MWKALNTKEITAKCSVTAAFLESNRSIVRELPLEKVLNFSEALFPHMSSDKSIICLMGNCEG